MYGVEGDGSSENGSKILSSHCSSREIMSSLLPVRIATLAWVLSRSFDMYPVLVYSSMTSRMIPLAHMQVADAMWPTHLYTGLPHAASLPE